MSSKIDMPLDKFVKPGRGRGRGRRRGGFNNGGSNTTFKGRGGLRGVGQTAPVNITSRLGFTTKLNKSSQNGVKTKSVQKVSDLRDILSTKSKTVPDLRAKLPPKAGKQTEKVKTSGRQSKAESPLKISSEMFRVSKSKGDVTSRSRDAIFGKSYKEIDTSRKLPTTSEAKKITVTVQGLNKTASEAYRKEERLAAVITRQKESRQQNFMKSREEFIASSITSALSGDGRGSGGDISSGRGVATSYHKQYRSPSPPSLDYAGHYELPPPPPPPPPSSMGMGPLQSRNRIAAQSGITSVTTLIISNLNDTVSHSDVLELCNAIGPVDNVVMSAPGVAEVTFRYKDDALEAYKKYNQRNLDGMPMMCRLQPGPARPRTLPPPHHQVNSYTRFQDAFIPESMYGNHGNYY